LGLILAGDVRQIAQHFT